MFSTFLVKIFYNNRPIKKIWLRNDDKLLRALKKKEKKKANLTLPAAMFTAFSTTNLPELFLFIDALRRCFYNTALQRDFTSILFVEKREDGY